MLAIILNKTENFTVSHRMLFYKTIVRKSARIGANATIVCGVRIGECPIVISGAVVAKDVPPFPLVIGNPGKIIGKVDKKGNRIKKTNY